MNARCIRCGEDHEVTVCERMEEADPTCANCGENHRATAKACKKRTEFIEIRKRASTRNQPKRTNAAPPTLDERNFPAITRQRNNIPNLPPLQPQQRLAAAANSVSLQTPRLQAAPAPAPGTNAWSQPPPGFRRGQDNSKVSDSPPPQDAPLYQSEQLVPIFEEMAVRLRGCKTRYDQIYTLGMLLIQYG